MGLEMVMILVLPAAFLKTSCKDFSMMFVSFCLLKIFGLEILVIGLHRLRRCQLPFREHIWVSGGFKNYVSQVGYISPERGGGYERSE